MRILLSNDDGVHAPGLKAMYDELKKLGDVWVVAPLEEKSTTGHSLTIHKPLRMLPMGPRCQPFGRKQVAHLGDLNGRPVLFAPVLPELRKFASDRGNGQTERSEGRASGYNVWK